MASGGFAGSTFGDQIERVYRNVMSNQREFVAQLSAAYTTPVAETSKPNTTLYIQGAQAQSIQVGSILAIDEEVFLVMNAICTSQTGSAYTVTVIPAYEGSVNASHNAGTAVYINPKYTRWAISVALNDALAAMSAPGMGLMREYYTTITYNPVLRGYDLQSAGVSDDFHTILSLSYDLPDPSHYYPTMRSFRVQRGLKPTGGTNSKIPGGYALFVNSSAMPGLPMMLAVGGPFIPATFTTQDMNADLGLPLTALDIPAIRAEIDLTLVREIKRNFTEGQPDLRKAADVVAGNVMNSTSGLEALYQKRMDEEANRFRNRWPMMKPI
jgi:hypothetical protein